MKRIMSLILATLIVTSPLALTPAADKEKAKAKEKEPEKELVSKESKAARERGLDWLTKNQAKDGSWGQQYTIAITSFACLAYLSASDEPFTGDRGKALVKGLAFLMSQQKDGMFKPQGSSWLHAQGFGTLALSEAYGRSLFCKTEPDADMKKIRDAVAKAVAVICENQSNSGGWPYQPKTPDQHEGSTTVCAVQAIISAKNFGIKVDEKVMEKGFDYLKKCQTAEGGFNYILGDKQNMKEGTAAGMATLGLMSKFDNEVMVKAHKFLQKTTPAGISKERFPFYGHFYGCMGMNLLGQEFGDSKEYREQTRAYIADAHKELIVWQDKDGSWPMKGAMAGVSGGENNCYSTSFALIGLFAADGKLSILSRTPPELPKEKKPEEKKREEKK